jgi:hypothetical protein
MAKKKKNQIKFGHDALHQIICNMWNIFGIPKSMQLWFGGICIIQEEQDSNIVGQFWS